MLKFWLSHFYKFHKQWMNFNVYLNSFCFNWKKGNFFLNASYIPRIIREVSNFWLEISYWSKLFSIELKLSFSPIENQFFNVFCWPALLLFIPNTNFNFIVFSCKNIVWKFENCTYRVVWLRLRARIWIWNFF